jgi:hypothetical protein
MGTDPSAHDKAATVIQARDIPLAPGQFRYQRTDTTMLDGHTGRRAYHQHDTDEVWIPADPEAEWLLRQDLGRIEWLDGEDPDATTLPGRFRREDRARYGTFDQDNGPEPSWYHLTPEFLAGLPRDPSALLALIEREYAKAAHPGKAQFQHATHLLLGGALPADLRTALYQAMVRIEGVTVDGTVIGFSDGRAGREELIVDPTDGVPSGRRWLRPDGAVTGTAVITHRVTGAPTE